ncbi:MAG: GreA/GreB family elongation factor, partial [Lachnospiraceae bacterium]|nr:GreA/GreB family elongation factor [Lachnospiraceae bacterium]
RIRYLERMLRTATIIPDSSKDDEVGLNNKVVLYFEEDDEEQEYKVVTSIRGNSLENRISNESPIGRAIIGHKVGDRVSIKVNDSYSYYVQIRAIDKTPADDDEIKKF